MKWFHGLVALALIAGCSKSTANKETPAKQQPAANAASAESKATSGPINPDIELAIVDYQAVMEQIASKRGKVVVMDAWSTSCPPCMEEFHNLVEIHKQYGPEKVACVSLSFDYEGIDRPEDQRPRVLEFLQQQGATFDNFMSTEESDVLYKKLDLAAVPAVFVYDQEGKLRKRFDNEQAKSKGDHFTYDDVKKLVAELVAEPSAASAAESGEAATSEPPAAPAVPGDNAEK